MRENRSSGTLVVIASLLLLLAGYVGAYLATSKPVHNVIRYPDGTAELRGYREDMGGRGYIEPLFWPLSQLDRQLRPERWH